MLPSPSEVADALLYANTTHCQGQGQCQRQGLCHLYGQCQSPCLCQASITPAPLPVPAPGPVPVPAPAPVPGQQVKRRIWETLGRLRASCPDIDPKASSPRHPPQGREEFGRPCAVCEPGGPDIDPKASRPPVGNKAGTHQSQPGHQPLSIHAQVRHHPQQIHRTTEVDCKPPGVFSKIPRKKAALHLDFTRKE